MSREERNRFYGGLIYSGDFETDDYMSITAQAARMKQDERFDRRCRNNLDLQAKNKRGDTDN